MKNLLRSIIIFWGITAIFPLCCLIYTFFTVGEGSHWLFGFGDGQALATTWVDSNANGIPDPDEKPLANVCIWYGYGPESGTHLDFFCEIGKGDNSHFTDEHGMWGQFLPGGKCTDVFVFVQVPEGYQATTNLASNACDAKFGFVSDKIKIKLRVLTVEQFIQRQTMILWAKRISIGLIILLTSISGTIWLQKNQ